MINTKTIEDAIFSRCVEANTTLPDDIFAKLLQAYNSEENSEAKQTLGLILTNAKMAYEKKMPLCQDTGQVLVFVKGKCFPEGLNDAINKGVERAYEDNFYRKSVVKNALFNRTNTKTNAPCVIYTEITDKDGLELEVLIKGAGSENVSVIEMLSPTSTEDEILEFIVSAVEKAGSKACPPYFLGIGIGGTIEYAGLLSKKALLLEKNIDAQHENLATKIKKAINDLNIGAAGFGGASTALDVKILTGFTHIACMPVAVTINCHSSRHAKCTINESNDIVGRAYQPDNINHRAKFDAVGLVSPTYYTDFIKVNTSDIEQLKLLKQGQNVLLSGEIYTARDMAHKRLLDLIKKGESLPFDIKNSIIFYAGPCPCTGNCIVGSIGPTTSSRMDKFAPALYEKGVLATIGKGERSEQCKASIKETGGLYFSLIGGIACYLSEKFVKKELIAFEDLGAEAIYKFEVKDLPLRLDFC